MAMLVAGTPVIAHAQETPPQPPNLTPEQREEMWRRMTPEQRARFWRSLTPEQRQTIREQIPP
ncbi:MAG TPA: hypothetical protein VFR86_07565, partial [Burkholderiaceae bacterium]|nr:hypothetical protein [Burkholderiaceae bacterium]